MKFVIFHGSFGSPEGNWFPELRERLELLGQKVIVPKFPTEDWTRLTEKGSQSASKNQNLQNWFKTFGRILKSFKTGEPLCFVGHSLGPLFILHIVEKYNINLDSAIFVSPFLERLGGQWQIELVNKTFYKTDFDWKKLKELIPVSYVLYSDNDPYVPKKYSMDCAQKLGSSTIFVKGAAHMNINKIVNLNEFPLVLELCKSRLDLTLYQQYLAHRRELFAVPYTKKEKTEEVFYISARDYFDEGRFKFRNLRREGFCTLFFGINHINPHSIYMEEARNAARRIGNFTRIFIANNLADFKKKFALEQIRADMDAGINVYFCMWSDIKKKVKEPDFGIWDGEYLCITHFDKNYNMKEERISGRKSEMEKARTWQKEVMKHATRIRNADKDVAAFIKAHS